MLAGLAALLGGGCSSGESRPVRTGTDGGETDGARGPRPTPPTDVTLPGIAAGRGGYQPRAVTDAGSIAGTVTLAGEAPPDTTIVPDSSDVRVCGARLVDRAVEGQGSSVGGAVVWLTDVRSGKALPAFRRHELTLADCTLEPRAIAAVAGGTLNVKGLDRLVTRMRVARWPAGEVVSTIRMTDAGQVVPDERVLERPGQLEVRGIERPWLRSWLLVFDHPYFETTGADGAFTLAEVPPGSYRLVAWHPRLGRSEQAVTVAAGLPARVDLRLGTGPAPSTAAPAAGGTPTDSAPTPPAAGPDTAREAAKRPRR